MPPARFILQLALLDHLIQNLSSSNQVYKWFSKNIPDIREGKKIEVILGYCARLWDGNLVFYVL